MTIVLALEAFDHTELFASGGLGDVNALTEGGLQGEVEVVPGVLLPLLRWCAGCRGAFVSTVLCAPCCG